MAYPWFVVQRRVAGEVESFYFREVQAPDAEKASDWYASAAGNGTAAGPFDTKEEAIEKRKDLEYKEIDRLRELGYYADSGVI